MTDNGKIFGKLDWFSCMFYNTSIVQLFEFLSPRIFHTYAEKMSDFPQQSLDFSVFLSYNVVNKIKQIR